MTKSRKWSPPALLAAVVLSPALSAAAAGDFAANFAAIAPQEMTDNVFTLVGQDFSVVTAGAIPGHNSMTASFGGFGILFGKPTAWLFLRSSRYTLELMEREKTFTLSYFPDAYKEQVVFFGEMTGRGTDKMKRSTLTPISTPSGLPTYAEARLVVECALVEVTETAPGDFLTGEGRDFVGGGRDASRGYHRLVFGEITGVWVKRE